MLLWNSNRHIPVILLICHVHRYRLIFFFLLGGKIADSSRLAIMMGNLSAEYGIILLNFQSMTIDDFGHYCMIKTSRNDFRWLTLKESS